MDLLMQAKAEAYDILATIEGLQLRLREKNQQIAALIDAQAQTQVDSAAGSSESGPSSGE